jgi:hypothetical protein
MAMSYDPNTDYQALINKAVEAGAYDVAAYYEQQRNAKIAGMNAAGTNQAGYVQTDLYAQQAAAQPQPVQQTSSSSSMIRDMYDSALQAKIAALEGGYKASLADATAARGKIPGIYQAQADSVAANAGREKMAFNEYAAASGLNSGAGGQAALALSGQLQSGLTAVRTGQANATADADLQIARLQAQYQQARQQAVAETQAQRAAAMLDQYNTDQQRAIQQQQFDANMGFQREQFQYGQEQDALDRQLAYDKLMASSRGGSGGGSGGSGNDANIYQTMAGLGIRDERGAYAYLLSKGYTATEADQLAIYYMEIMAQQQAPEASAYSQFSPAARQILSMAQRRGGNTAQYATAINNALNSGQITEAEADYLLSRYGL